MGVVEGHRSGLERGFGLGSEVGVYAGAVATMRALQRAHPDAVNARADRAMGGMEDLLSSFPLCDAQVRGSHGLAWPVTASWGVERRWGIGDAMGLGCEPHAPVPGAATHAAGMAHILIPVMFVPSQHPIHTRPTRPAIPYELPWNRTRASSRGWTSCDRGSASSCRRWGSHSHPWSLSLKRRSRHRRATSSSAPPPGAVPPVILLFHGGARTTVSFPGMSVQPRWCLGDPRSSVRQPCHDRNAVLNRHRRWIPKYAARSAECYGSKPMAYPYPCGQERAQGHRVDGTAMCDSWCRGECQIQRIREYMCRCCGKGVCVCACGRSK